LFDPSTCRRFFMLSWQERMDVSDALLIYEVTQTSLKNGYRALCQILRFITDQAQQKHLRISVTFISLG
jgi:hypothetical protein